jgi:hypothetical protein
VRAVRSPREDLAAASAARPLLDSPPDPQRKENPMANTEDKQIKNDAELTEGELETVAGGVDGNDGGCTTQPSKPWQKNDDDSN